MNASPQLLEKARNRLHADVVCTLSGITSIVSSRQAVPYFGTVGIRNLGDELLLEAARRSFPDRTLVPLDARRAPHRQALRRLATSAPALLVGGGTLLMSQPLRRTLDEGLRAGLGFSTFGSGVEDPRFVGDFADSQVASWRRLLAGAEHLGVRGPRSCEILAEIGVTTASVVGDPAVVMSLSGQPSPRRGRVVGVNLGTAWGAVWGQSEADAVRQAVKSIRRLMDSGWHVRLFSVWPPDTRLLHEIARMVGLPRSAVAVEYRSPHRFMANIQGCDVFVGMKLHAQVLAMCAGVPTLALEYQPKTTDFLRLVDSVQDALRFDQLQADALVSAVDRLWRDHSDAQERQWGNCRRVAAGFIEYVHRIGGDVDGLARWAGSAATA
jgi:hypothetical protein